MFTREGGGEGGVCLTTSLCLRGLGLITPPPLGAPAALFTRKHGVCCLFPSTGGVSFSYLLPFLFRFILSCLRGSFSIKNETDRDRTTLVFLTRWKKPRVLVLSLILGSAHCLPKYIWLLRLLYFKGLHLRHTESETGRRASKISPICSIFNNRQNQSTTPVQSQLVQWLYCWTLGPLAISVTQREESIKL